jgi:hypothetical protein
MNNLRTGSRQINQNTQLKSNTPLVGNVTIPTKTSPTISSIPFIPLSMNTEGSEIQGSDGLIGHEGEPIILTKAARPSRRARDKLINRLLAKLKIWRCACEHWPVDET